MTRHGSATQQLMVFKVALGFAAALAFTLASVAAPSAGNATASRTRVSIAGGHWQINGEVTYPGAQAEGLLLNVRMVNAVFEDRNRTDFDPDVNPDVPAVGAYRKNKFD